jgi:hypothetical protein
MTALATENLMELIEKVIRCSKKTMELEYFNSLQNI